LTWARPFSSGLLGHPTQPAHASRSSHPRRRTRSCRRDLPSYVGARVILEQVACRGITFFFFGFWSWGCRLHHLVVDWWPQMLAGGRRGIGPFEAGVAHRKADALFRPERCQVGGFWSCGAASSSSSRAQWRRCGLGWRMISISRRDLITQPHGRAFLDARTSERRCRRRFLRCGVPGGQSRSANRFIDGRPNQFQITMLPTFRQRPCRPCKMRRGTAACPAVWHHLLSRASAANGVNAAA